MGPVVLVMMTVVMSVHVIMTVEIIVMMIIIMVKIWVAMITVGVRMRLVILGTVVGCSCVNVEFDACNSSACLALKVQMRIAEVNF